MSSEVANEAEQSSQGCEWQTLTKQPKFPTLAQPEVSRSEINKRSHDILRLIKGKFKDFSSVFQLNFFPA